ncbi:hypothetical protein Hanom_Chr17g01529391 [Helianthus anomalus]
MAVCSSFYNYVHMHSFICTYAFGAGYGSLPPQDVERAYGAVCAPDFYLFKKVHSLAKKSW